MRKVVDSNFLQSEKLGKYLSKSDLNYAVLTDYLAMEAYKGDTLASIYRSMEVISQYPRQVIVLKGTQIVCGLRGRRSGLQKRLIDMKQTRDFQGFCRSLNAAKGGNKNIEKGILNLGRDADDQMDRMLADAVNFPDAIRSFTDTFSKTEIKCLRGDLPLPSETINKFIENTLRLAAVLFWNHPRVTKLPAIPELYSTFIFRVSLCVNFLFLEWVSVGSPENVKPEKVRNDFVDSNFAAYATFFDGLLTEDKKLNRIHKNTAYLLRVLQP